MMSFWVGVRSRGRWGSDGVDDGFAVEAHQVDVLHVLAEAIHILQVGVNGVEALHTCCAGCNDHLLTGAHQFHTALGNAGLQSRV